jgi:ProP effector
MSRLSPAKLSALLTQLCERFPKCFVWFEDKRRPLKCRIHADILAVGGFDPHELGHVLSAYTCNAKYRSRLVEGAERIDLNGEPAGNVTFEEQLRAQELNAIFYAKARRRLQERHRGKTVESSATKSVSVSKQRVTKKTEEAKAPPHPWPVLKLKAFR